jgi:DNA polymerase III epsilon subunit-like protein
MTNIMLDLETLGTKLDSVILSIGAVAFNEECITNEFYTTINVKSCVDKGLKMYPDTVCWWATQSDAAKKGIFESKITLPAAISDFSLWVKSMGDNPIRMWGNGEDFDNAILREAYFRVEVSPSRIPWHFKNNMSYRTLKNLLPHVKMDRVGEHHNALDDAKSQALHAIKLLKELHHGIKK